MPISLDAIQQYLGRYASPEAAESDLQFNAPTGASSFLAKQYQNLTGDPFSDPIQDAKRNRDAAALAAANSGASFASGSNMGPTMLSAPPIASTAPVSSNPQSLTPSTNTMGQPLSAVGQHEVSNSLLTSMLQQQGSRYQMANASNQLPSPNSNQYFATLQTRANAAGAGDLFNEIHTSDPTVFAKGISSDPRFARIQGGKNGKIEAADSIHPLAMNSRFIQETKQNPERAKALYAAATNGRDYQTDIEAKSQLLSEQSDSRKKLLEGVKSVKADPITGELHKIVEVKNSLTGKLEAQEIPLSDMEKSAIDAEGGFKRIYGVDIPNRGGVTLPGRPTAEQNKQYQSIVGQLVKSGKSLEEAKNIAHTQMYKATQSAGVATLQNSNNENGRGMLDTMMGYSPIKDLGVPIANFGIRGANGFNSLLNLPSRATNAVSSALGSNYRGALIPPIPLLNDQVDSVEATQRNEVADLLRQKMQAASSGFIQ